MVAAYLQPQSCGFGTSLKEKQNKHERPQCNPHDLFCDNCNSKAGGLTHTPSRSEEELKNKKFLQTSHGQEHGRKKNKILPMEWQQSQEGDINRKYDAKALVALLKVCTKNEDLERGTKLHDDILKSGLLDNCSNALATMYAKCGQLEKAKALLDTHKSRNLISWTALIAGHVREGQSQDALDCFEYMQREGIPPDAVTFACVLRACGAIRAADQGKAVHIEIVRQGLLQNDVVLGNALVDMYVKCSALVKAKCVLQELPLRDVVSWNTLIAGYVQQGENKEALNCYSCMQHEGIPPDDVTYACILKACGSSGDVFRGIQIHDELARQGLLQSSILVGNALVDMYAKCGDLKKAQLVLMELPSRDVVTWNALIAGYAQHGQGEQTLNSYEHMQDEGIPADIVTFTCILNACGTIGASRKGKRMHSEIVRRGFLLDSAILGNTLVDMYAKCGALEEAQHVLRRLHSRDVVSWSALITGYTKQGQGEQALDCYECMQQEGIRPDAMTFASLLKACGILGAVDKGKQIHEKIARQGLLGSDVVLGNALVYMYSKIGFLAKARCVLGELHSRDVFSWNALIVGYVQQGQGGEVLDCFKCMQQEGIPPNEVTFSCVLNVCSHLGLVEEGDRIFEEMSTKYGLKPTLEGYTCMIDLFGRAGLFGKAVNLIQGMPSSDYSTIWHALLGACRRWADVNVGRWAFEQAILVDKRDGAAYVLMADTYAAACMQGCVKDIESMEMENEGVC